MLWYQWVAVAAFGICVISCLFQFLRIIRLGNPEDFAKSAGNVAGGVKYAFTGAMSPLKKESAFLHLPTYTAGLLYHTGTFLCFALFFLILTGNMPGDGTSAILGGFLFISLVSGTGILLKRIVRKELRALSNPDDFISNILVTLFQFFTLLVIAIPLLAPAPLPAVLQSYSPTVLTSYSPFIAPSYYLLFTLLMLYLPVGKLRHTVYFFAARYHLGFFYGRRGTWPPKQVKTNNG